MNPEEDRPQATIVRAIGFENRYKKIGFRLDDETLGHIREAYIPRMDKSIADYMNYKGLPKEFYGIVMERLREIVE